VSGAKAGMVEAMSEKTTGKVMFCSEDVGKCSVGSYLFHDEFVNNVYILSAAST